MTVLDDEFMERVMTTESEGSGAMPYRTFDGIEAVSNFEQEPEHKGDDSDE